MPYTFIMGIFMANIFYTLVPVLPQGLSTAHLYYSDYAEDKDATLHSRTIYQPS